MLCLSMWLAVSATLAGERASKIGLSSPLVLWLLTWATKPALGCWEPALKP